MKNSYIFSTLFALSVLVTTPALAQPRETNAVELSSDVKVIKTTQEEGGEPKVELVDPNLVVPGDRLIFRTSFKNSSDEVAKNFVVNNAMHSAVVLASDNDPSLLVSVDGGMEFGLLPELEIAMDDGTMRAAEAADVTNVRWILEELQSGESGQIFFYAIVR